MHIQVQVELQMKIPSRDGEAEVEKKKTNWALANFGWFSAAREVAPNGLREG